MKKIVAIAFMFFLVVGIAFELTTGFFSGVLRGPVVVAILDTGIDTRIPALGARLSDKRGRNFFDDNDDVADEDGHGTKVALLTIQSCLKGCRILPIKMTKHGAGMTPRDLAAAIRLAVEGGARVINISAGMNQGSPELETAVREAVQRGVVLVAAAGNGVTNPFRPEPLDKVYPQSYPDVFVVGAAKSLDLPDPLTNFGDELDLVVTGQEDDALSSSFAAAVVSGAVADVLATARRLSATEVRDLARSTTTAPSPLRSGAPLSEVIGRLGFGAFDATACRARASALWLDTSPTIRRYWNQKGEADVEISAGQRISSIKADWDCAAKPADGLYVIEARVLKKSRARVTLSPTAAPGQGDAGSVVNGPETDLARATALRECPLTVTLTFAAGGSASLRVAF